MKKDIKDTTDIKLLVDSFYTQVQQNSLLKEVFVDTMKVNWDRHLPKMYSFWEFILFHTGEYKGAPFPHHIAVNEKIKITSEHFSAWINLFYETVDTLFEGENANTIKNKANNIKLVWDYKMKSINEGLD